MMGPGASGGAKNLSGFLKNFAGNLGGEMSGMGLAGNPLSGIGIMKQLMGGGKGGGEEGYDPTQQDNPGNKMFGAKPTASVMDSHRDGSFLKRFAGGMSDQLFQNAMMGFMGRR